MELTLYAQAFGKDESFSADGATAAEALRSCEAKQGSPVFIGHTELLCLDGSHTLEEVRDLLSSQGLSPACKLLCTQVDGFFEAGDMASPLADIRMAERCGLLAQTDLSTVLDEWLGNAQTALLPATRGSDLRMVLLHIDGTCTLLSEDAACGMYWLRRHENDEFTMTVKTDSGMQDIPILRSTLRKDALTTENAPLLRYTLTVHTDDCPEDARPVLQETIAAQCRTAVQEMLAADADVIGIQTLAAFGGLDAAEAVIEVVVTIK